MRKAAVYRNGELAGVLEEDDARNYVFRYADGWWADSSKPAISLTLPKSQQEYRSASRMEELIGRSFLDDISKRGYLLQFRARRNHLNT